MYFQNICCILAIARRVRHPLLLAIVYQLMFMFLMSRRSFIIFSTALLWFGTIRLEKETLTILTLYIKYHTISYIYKIFTMSLHCQNSVFSNRVINIYLHESYSMLLLCANLNCLYIDCKFPVVYWHLFNWMMIYRNKTNWYEFQWNNTSSK